MSAMKYRSLPFRSALLALALFGAAAPGWSQTAPGSPAPYSVIDISQFLASNSVGGGTETTDVGDINDHGQLVANFGGRAYVVRGGESTDIPFPDPGVGFGLGLSPAGKVTGHFLAGTDLYQAFLFDGAQLTDIDSADHFRSLGYAVNDAGQVAGTYQTVFTLRAARFSNGNVLDIPFPDPFSPEEPKPGYVAPEPASSDALDINSAGHITGFVYFDGFGLKPFYFDGVSTHYMSLDFGDGAGYALNDGGQVVGYSQTEDGNLSATLWTNKGQTQTFLPPLNDTFNTTIANDINNQGQIVGLARTVEENRRAVLWQNGQIIDLNTLIPANSGWVLEDATHINNRGEILGRGRINQGEERQFVLTLRAGDTIAPVTSANVQGNTGNDGWITDAAQVSLTARDNGGTQALAGTGVASTFVRIGSGPARPYSGPLSFENSGRYSIRYWSVDKVGHVEPTKTVAFKIDNQPPRVTAERALQLPLPFDKEWVLIHGTLSDAHSGPDKSSVSYSVYDEFGTFVSSGPVQTRANGSFDFSVTLPSKVARHDKDGRPFQVVVSARDVAGNTGSETVYLVVGKKGSSHSG
jgi:probable HAF family extracellular repeat protein